MLKYVTLGIIGLAGCVNPALAKQNPISECVLQQRRALDDGVTRSDAVARAIVHACKTVILAEVKRNFPFKTETVHRIISDKVETRLEKDALVLVLKSRVKDDKPVVSTFRPGDVLPAETSPLKKEEETCSFACVYSHNTLDREEALIVSPSKSNLVLVTLVGTYPANETACRKAVDTFLHSRRAFDVREASQSDADNTPDLHGLVVVRFYRGKKEDVSFFVGCFVRRESGRFLVLISETDDKAYGEEFDKLIHQPVR